MYVDFSTCELKNITFKEYADHSTGELYQQNYIMCQIFLWILYFFYYIKGSNLKISLYFIVSDTDFIMRPHVKTNVGF